MNRKERVLAALRGEKTDRVPVSFWRHFRDETGNPPMGRKSAQYHLDFFRETGVDFVKIMYDGFSAPFAFDKVETVTDLVRAVASGPKEDYVLGRASYWGKRYASTSTCFLLLCC